MNYCAWICFFNNTSEPNSAVSLKDLWAWKPPQVASLKCSTIMWKAFFPPLIGFMLGVVYHSIFSVSYHLSFHIWAQFQEVFYNIFVNSQEMSCSTRRKDKVWINILKVCISKRYTCYSYLPSMLSYFHMLKRSK